jgi:DNA-binding transcriptional LysR family regulator
VIAITLVEDNSGPLTERVRSGELDLALIGTAGAPPAGLGALVLTSEPIVAAVPFDHLLSTQDRITLLELSAFPIVCMPEGTAPRAMFDQACATNAVKPKVELQASAPDAVADLAVRGLGVAILTESMFANHKDRLKALVIDDVVGTVGLALIWTTSRSPALEEFLLRSREAFVDPLSRRVIRTGGRAAR